MAENNLKIKPILDPPPKRKSKWKICIHWSAGPYKRTDLDFQHYHFSVGDNAIVEPGKFKPNDNIPSPVTGQLRSGQYAAHCGGGNSYAIGFSLRGMAGYSSPLRVGAYPLLPAQCEAAWKFLAELCIKYDIVISPDTVYTHYEFGKRHPDSTSAGKIDITHLPFGPARQLPAEKIGDYIRAKITWYREKIESEREE